MESPASLLKTSLLPSRVHIILVSVGIAAMSGFAAYVIFQNYQTALTFRQRELSTSVRYQAWILRSSLLQSQDDAQVLADSTSTRKLLAGVARGDSSISHAALQEQALSLFREYKTIYEYDALYLFDAKAQVAVEASSMPGDSVAGSAKFKDLFGSVTRNRHFVVGLGPSLNKRLNLIFMMPVFADTITGGLQGAEQSLIGVVVIVDPIARELLPLLITKMVGTRTGETALLELEAGGGRYVSPRHPLSGLNHSLLVSDTLRLAVPLAVESRAVFGQFVDYRGVPVMAAMEKIESINSVLVCKMDNTEALVNFHRVVSIEVLTALSILLAYGGSVLMYNRRALAHEMHQGLARQKLANQVLEIAVIRRTTELAQMNERLHQELGEREKAEEEVRRINSELDQRVRERTTELESANKDLEAFSYSVSHDLRAPLRRMRSFSTILMEEYAPQLPEEVQGLLKVVNTNAVQMGELINGLLAFSQLGLQPLRKQKVIPGEIVRLAWQDLCLEWKERRVEIVIGDLSVCEADALLLKQVFINLLSNALKYSRTRETTKIEIGRTTSAAYYVRDNGVGFDMRFGSKLFGVFKRLHRSQDYEGLGIGLAIVERIVHRHGGRIWADALVNQGATFYFTLE